MSGLSSAQRSVTRLATEYVAREVGFWRRELIRPWETGGTERAARIGRWIGLGLAIGSAVAGIAAALRAERRRG